MATSILLSTGVTLVIVLVGSVIGLWAGFAKTDGGEVAVVRNGGWFDDNKIRQVIQPASGLTWVGMWSKVHRYPAQQRYYTMTADPERGGRPGIDLARSPSSDGVEMGIEATRVEYASSDSHIIFQRVRYQFADYASRKCRVRRG